MKQILLNIICAIKGHDMIYWEENIDHCAICIEFGRCERCRNFCFVADVKNQ
jgi:hypothetical protein